MVRDILRLNLEPIPKYAHVMTIEEWNDSIELDLFTALDGHGHWSTEKGMDCSADCFDEKPEWATHVAWFNK